jgi:hypothetical protein
MSSARPEKPIASSWWRDKLAMALVPAFGTALSRRLEVWMKNKRSPFVSRTRPRTFRRNMIS